MFQSCHQQNIYRWLYKQLKQMKMQLVAYANMLQIWTESLNLCNKFLTCYPENYYLEECLKKFVRRLNY